MSKTKTASERYPGGCATTVNLKWKLKGELEASGGRSEVLGSLKGRVHMLLGSELAASERQQHERVSPCVQGEVGRGGTHSLKTITIVPLLSTTYVSRPPRTKKSFAIPISSRTSSPSSTTNF